MSEQFKAEFLDERLRSTELDEALVRALSAEWRHRRNNLAARSFIEDRIFFDVPHEKSWENFALFRLYVPYPDAGTLERWFEKDVDGRMFESVANSIDSVKHIRGYGAVMKKWAVKFPWASASFNCGGLDETDGKAALENLKRYAEKKGRNENIVGPGILRCGRRFDREGVFSPILGRPGEKNLLDMFFLACELGCPRHGAILVLEMVGTREFDAEATKRILETCFGHETIKNINMSNTENTDVRETFEKTVGELFDSGRTETSPYESIFPYLAELVLAREVGEKHLLESGFLSSSVSPDFLSKILDHMVKKQNFSLFIKLFARGERALFSALEGKFPSDIDSFLSSLDEDAFCFAARSIFGSEKDLDNTFLEIDGIRLNAPKGVFGHFAGEMFESRLPRASKEGRERYARLLDDLFQLIEETSPKRNEMTSMFREFLHSLNRPEDVSFIVPLACGSNRPTSTIASCEMKNVLLKIDFSAASFEELRAVIPHTRSSSFVMSYGDGASSFQQKILEEMISKAEDAEDYSAVLQMQISHECKIRTAEAAVEAAKNGCGTRSFIPFVETFLREVRSIFPRYSPVKEHREILENVLGILLDGDVDDKNIGTVFHALSLCGDAYLSVGDGEKAALVEKTKLELLERACGAVWWNKMDETTRYNIYHDTSVHGFPHEKIRLRIKHILFAHFLQSDELLTFNCSDFVNHALENDARFTEFLRRIADTDVGGGACECVLNKLIQYDSGYQEFSNLRKIKMPPEEMFGLIRDLSTRLLRFGENNPIHGLSPFVSALVFATADRNAAGDECSILTKRIGKKRSESAGRLLDALTGYGLPNGILDNISEMFDGKSPISPKCLKGAGKLAERLALELERNGDPDTVKTHLRFGKTVLKKAMKEKPEKFERWTDAIVAVSAALEGCEEEADGMPVL